MGSTILVVDDDDDIRLMVRTMLVPAGYEVRDTASGREGLEMARRGDVDAILLDLHIPDLDAWSFLVRAWDDSRIRAIPIILFTAAGDEEVERRAWAWGCRGYLAKPFSAEQCLRALEKVLDAA